MFPSQGGKRRGSHKGMDSKGWGHRLGHWGHHRGCLPHWGMMVYGPGHPPLQPFQTSRVSPLSQAGDLLSQNHQLPEG